MSSSERKGEVSLPLPLPWPTHTRLGTVSLSSPQAFAYPAIKWGKPSLLPHRRVRRLYSFVLIMNERHGKMAMSSLITISPPTVWRVRMVAGNMAKPRWVTRPLSTTKLLPRMSWHSSLDLTQNCNQNKTAYCIICSFSPFR